MSELPAVKAYCRTVLTFCHNGSRIASGHYKAPIGLKSAVQPIDHLLMPGKEAVSLGTLCRGCLRGTLQRGVTARASGSGESNLRLLLLLESFT